MVIKVEVERNKNLCRKCGINIDDHDVRLKHEAECEWLQLQSVEATLKTVLNFVQENFAPSVIRSEINPDLAKQTLVPESSSPAAATGLQDSVNELDNPSCKADAVPKVEGETLSNKQKKKLRKNEHRKKEEMEADAKRMRKKEELLEKKKTSIRKQLIDLMLKIPVPTVSAHESSSSSAASRLQATVNEQTEEDNPSKAEPLTLPVASGPPCKADAVPKVEGEKISNKQKKKLKKNEHRKNAEMEAAAKKERKKEELKVTESAAANPDQIAELLEKCQVEEAPENVTVEVAVVEEGGTVPEGNQEQKVNSVQVTTVYALENVTESATANPDQVVELLEKSDYQKICDWLDALENIKADKVGETTPESSNVVVKTYELDEIDKNFKGLFVCQLEEVPTEEKEALTKKPIKFVLRGKELQWEGEMEVAAASEEEAANNIIRVEDEAVYDEWLKDVYLYLQRKQRFQFPFV